MITGLRTQEQIVTAECQAISAYTPTVPILFPVGSIPRALVEAHARTAVWLESLTEFVLDNTRLSTSSGIYVDSFIADFSLTRGAGVAAVGVLTFSSYSDATIRLITPTAQASTSDGTVIFQVTIDTTNAYWNVAQNAYVIPIGTLNISVPAVCTVTGVIGNVLSSTVNLIVSSITGIDNVTNAAAFVSGVNQQTDAQVRAAFTNYLNGLKRASLGALQYAVSSVNGVTDYILVENTNYTTQLPQLGYFYTVIDDGTGTPSDVLVTSVTNSLDIYRGYTIKYEVKKPIVSPITVSATVTLAYNYSSSTLQAAIQTAVVNYINTLGIGFWVYYFRIGNVIGDTINAQIGVPEIQNDFNVTSILLNSATADIQVTNKQTAVTSNASVTITVVTL